MVSEKLEVWDMVCISYIEFNISVKVKVGNQSRDNEALARADKFEEE